MVQREFSDFLINVNLMPLLVVVVVLLTENKIEDVFYKGSFLFVFPFIIKTVACGCIGLRVRINIGNALN